jgi:hypothetical protein
LLRRNAIAPKQDEPERIGLGKEPSFLGLERGARTTKDNRARGSTHRVVVANILASTGPAQAYRGEKEPMRPLLKWIAAGAPAMRVRHARVTAGPRLPFQRTIMHARWR